MPTQQQNIGESITTKEFDPRDILSVAFERTYLPASRENTWELINHITGHSIGKTPGYEVSEVLWLKKKCSRYLRDLFGLEETGIEPLDAEICQIRNQTPDSTGWKSKEWFGNWQKWHETTIKPAIEAAVIEWVNKQKKNLGCTIAVPAMPGRSFTIKRPPPPHPR